MTKPNSPTSKAPKGPSVARPGTVPYRTLAFMQARPETEEFSSAQLAEGIGQHPGGFGSLLAYCVTSKLLVRRMQGRIAWWSLGPAAATMTFKEEETANLRTGSSAGERPDRQVVSASAVNSIFAYADSRMAAPFSVAASSDGRLICQRHGRVVCEFNPTEAEVLRRVATQGVQP